MLHCQLCNDGVCAAVA